MQSTITKRRQHFDNCDIINFFFSLEKLKMNHLITESKYKLEHGYWQHTFTPPHTHRHECRGHQKIFEAGIEGPRKFLKQALRGRVHLWREKSKNLPKMAHFYNIIFLFCLGESGGGGRTSNWRKLHLSHPATVWVCFIFQIHHKTPLSNGVRNKLKV